MESSENKTFTLDLNIDSEIKALEVTRKETTDGQPYYVCKTDGFEVQLRKDEQWEVIWGELSAEKVEAIGSAIDKHIVKKGE